MIVVTGASGQLGRQVIERLLAMVEPGRLAASVRNPDTVTDLAERGVRVRPGDFDDPASLVHSFEGARRVLVISAGVGFDDAVRLNTNAVTAAIGAGAERVFYTSHVGVSADSAFPPMHAHAATEDFLRASGADFTAIRNGFYAEFAPMMMGNAAQIGELRAPADGPVSWTTHPDLAAGIAALLTDDRIDEQVVELTASEALTWAEIAAMAAEITGRPMTRVVVDDDEFAAGMADRGVPAERITSSLGIYQASRRGDFAAVDPALERLIGHAPAPFRTVLEHALTDTSG